MDFDEIDVGRRSLWCCWILLALFIAAVFALAFLVLATYPPLQAK